MILSILALLVLGLVAFVILYVAIGVLGAVAISAVLGDTTARVVIGVIFWSALITIVTWAVWHVFHFPIPHITFSIK